MKKIRIVYWGTPYFSVPSLEALHKNPRIEIVAIVTQPDKPAHRSNKPIPPPVKEYGIKHNIPIFQPPDLKSKDFLTDINEYDYNVVVAYGNLIPKRLIELPLLGSINLHPSALPKYRGPAPIHYALLHGDKRTAIAIIIIDEEMDHGPIISQEIIDIDTTDNYESLLYRLANSGAKILLAALLDFYDKKITPIEQIHTKATYTKLLTKIDGELDWDSPQKVIYNKIRALNPWPGTYTFWKGKRLKILKALPLKATMLQPGEIALGNNKIHIGTRDGDIDILTIQSEGKNTQEASSFIKGNAKLSGQQLPN